MTTQVQLTFIAPTGAQNWVVPANLFVIDSCDVTAGGGNGAPGGSSQLGLPASGGYGGGAGSRAIKNAIPVTPGETLQIYVGANGGISGLYRPSTSTWLCRANPGSGQSGGAPVVYDSGTTGANGAPGNAGYYASPYYYSGSGGVGASSPNYGSGGPGGAGCQLGGGTFTGGAGGNATGYGCGGGGGGGGGFFGSPTSAGSGGLGYQGRVDIFYTPFVLWADNAGLSGQSQLAANSAALLPINSGLSAGGNLNTDISGPQLFAAVGLAPAAVLKASSTQPKSLQAGFAAASALGSYIGGQKQTSVRFTPQTVVSTSSRQTQRASAKLTNGPVFKPFLSQKQILRQVAHLSAEAVVLPPYVNLPEAIHIVWRPGVGFSSSVLVVKFIEALLSSQTGVSPDTTLEALQWINYGSEVLYAAASGLEKALIDVDAPRITQINAEAIVDIWDPYNCPLHLLPYLAWAMGVTFWNDRWSEDTKRAWVASQWQFKALRGTNAGIKMAVDFAGRDVSPYGYHVRDIITRPQGLYPSPGISKAAQEAWLATLPQVRVYLFDRSGQALRDEFYFNKSFIGTDVWDGQSFMTPNTAPSRLGKQATWNVGGIDVSDVSVLNFGNYFQLQMPGQAYAEELYCDESWPEFSFLTPSDAWKRLVTIEPLTEAPYRIAVGPSMRAIQSQPELICEPGIAGYDTFCGSNLYPHDGAGVFMAPSNQHADRQLRAAETLPAFPSFLLPSTTAYRVFERYPVYNPDNLPTGGTQGTMFCGVGWFDFQPFAAEVDVFMAGNRCPGEFAIDDFMLPNSRYLVPQDNAPLVYIAGAIEAARGLTDLTLLQPKPSPVFSVGKPFICGFDHYVIGQSQLGV